MVVEEKHIGLALAFSSSALIGFIITKKGLNDAAKPQDYSHSHQRQSGPRNASEDYAYLHNPIWWAGMITMVVGEVANFAAYTFAPAILVTPLGAMSVIIGAILASWFLDEKLGRLGVCGCASCIIGSVIIVLHAPSDKEVDSVDQILDYAARAPFLAYLTFVAVFSAVMIFRVSPRYGQTNPMVYLSICSLVGSISVCAIKGFGIALKLTFSGNNQLMSISTYVFGTVVVGCILVQMNYFNKALDTFSTNVVNPIYYVFFTTATITASAILFQGFNTTDGVNTVSLLCGFLVIFMGVYLLNISRQPEPPRAVTSHHHTSSLDTGLMNPRMSMSGRVSVESQGLPIWNYGANGVPPASYHADGTPHPGSHGRRSRLFHQQNTTLFNAFEEEGMALTQLPEEDSEDDDDAYTRNGRNREARNGEGRSLVGSRRNGEADGGRHPAYQDA